MQAFRSTDLQKQLRILLDTAGAEPAVLVNRGQPRLVVMSAEEFRRLKCAAGEAVPAAALPRRPLALHGGNEDPLGYDTADLRSAAMQIAEDALSGSKKTAVAAERARLLEALGLAAGGASPRRRA